jgi:hypothetical protein
MLDITNYGKMSKGELINELCSVSNTLYARLRELGGVTHEYNITFYDHYAKEPGSSVAAKERAANYNCVPLLNDLADVEGEIKALTVARDCITVILPYAD